MKERFTFRRFSAAMLLALFGLSLLSPLFGSERQSNLPACCRREGRHHCAGITAPGSGPALQSNAKCPMYPGVAPGTIPGCAYIPAVATAALVLPAHPARHDSNDLPFLFSSNDPAHGKRGPPVSFSAV